MVTSTEEILNEKLHFSCCDRKMLNILFYWWGKKEPHITNYSINFEFWIFLRSSQPKVFLEKGVLKICSKVTGEHLWRSAISIKLQSNIEITLRHGCPPVYLLYIFTIPFTKNTSGRLLPNFIVTETIKVYLGKPLRDRNFLSVRLLWGTKLDNLSKRGFRQWFSKCKLILIVVMK